ncbi:MAG: hypothetical protein MUO23_11015 [Anaerolineales bacterium]|nr:hypothetical protein [Anaerolineales bacterium]
MSLGLILQPFAPTIMTIGVALGVHGTRQLQAARRRASAILMLNSCPTSDFVRDLLGISKLPDDVGKEESDRPPEDKFLAI